jgi:hypothetical protein
MDLVESAIKQDGALRAQVSINRLQAAAQYEPVVQCDCDNRSKKLLNQFIADLQ